MNSSKVNSPRFIFLFCWTVNWSYVVSLLLGVTISTSLYQFHSLVGKLLIIYCSSPFKNLSLPLCTQHARDKSALTPLISLSLSSSFSIFCISIFHETQLQPPAVPHKGRNHLRYRCTHCLEIRGRLSMSSLHTSETVEEGRANGLTRVILWHWTSYLYNNLS